MHFKTIEYNQEKNEITILDQTRLPEEEVYMKLKTIEDVFNAIKNMHLRGAPLIGVAAAYGVVLAVRSGSSADIIKAADFIISARPTAANLGWAIERMKSKIVDGKNVYEVLLNEAKSIEIEDKESCQKMGKIGADIIPDNSKIMVHCNAGALATSGIGTALGILYTAKSQGKKIEVYSCETRPLLQGARLTSWELTVNSIETYTICDNMAATYMSDMNLVLVGADRIAGNGDTANKIGTKGLAIIAHFYKVPFYVAAPLSTFDIKIKSGSEIPIEIRCEDEIRKFHSKGIVAEKAKICNPAFDVTPASLISSIITEKSIIKPPYDKNIEKVTRNVK